MRILITGATSGIGRQLALDYAQEGHEVWAVGRNETALAELSEKGLNTVRLDLENRPETLAWFASMTPLDCAMELAAGISDARLVVAEDCGHLSTLERPETVNPAMRDWLGEP